MNKRRILTAFLLVIICGAAFGQKIKYKELFVLLNAKQYAESEVYLKRYLKANDDNFNAYLFMGLIYEDKATRTDILKNTQEYATQVDSAVYFFGLAYKGMTEKEISKNEEWYQMYNRRDMRTGKFGVTLSDVKLDLEDRMKKKERSKQAALLKSQFVAAEKAYKNSAALFASIQSKFTDQRHLYLQADDTLIMKLRHLESTMDSCHVAFNDYKATAKLMGKIGYNQDLNPQDITDFKKQVPAADFYADDIKIQDFKRWAGATIDVVEKEIKPIKDRLVAHDSELNKIQQHLKKDSVSIRTELTAVKAKGFDDLKKIDPNPMPLQVFSMKEAELEFGTQVVEHKPLRDSTSLSLQINGLKQEIALARKLDSIAGHLVERNIEEDATNYKHFVSTAYGTPGVLKNLIRSTKEFALREIIHRETALKRKSESLRWIVNGTDSIPLFTPVREGYKYRPFILQEEKFTAGLTFADSIGSGYFYFISPSRKPDIKANYNVNKQAFKKRNLAVTKMLSAGDDLGLVYFLLTYLETKVKDKYPATLTKIYKVEGLAWSVDVGFDQVPAEMIFSKETSELSVKTKSSIGEMFMTTFDRDGKALK